MVAAARRGPAGSARPGYVRGMRVVWLWLSLLAVLDPCVGRTPEEPRALYESSRRAALTWLYGVDVDATALMAHRIKGKKKLAEALGGYAMFRRHAGETEQRRIDERVRQLMAMPGNRGALYHDLGSTSTDDTTFKQNSMSYLRVLWLLQQLGHETAEYLDEVRSIKPRLDAHLHQRGPWQRAMFREYYQRFGLAWPSSLAVGTDGGIGPEVRGQLGVDAYDQNKGYALTHEVFVAFDYGDAPTQSRFSSEDLCYLSRILAPLVHRFLVEQNNVDLGAELVLCMRYLGLTTAPVYLDGIKRLFAAQASDGSWGDYSDAHPERRTLHTTMLAAHALIAAYEMDGFYRADLPEDCIGSNSQMLEPISSSNSREGTISHFSWHSLLDSLPSYETHGSTGRVQVYDSFLSEDEATELRDLGMELLKLTNQTNPYYRKAGFRQQKWWTRSPTLRRVRERVARLTGIPIEAHEEPPMYAWSSGNRVKPLHHDKNSNPKRYLTVILYLNTVSGGQTIFPCIRSGDSTETTSELCRALVADAQNGSSFHTVSRGDLWNRSVLDRVCVDTVSDHSPLRVAPVTGRALVFRSAGLGERHVDPTTWHAGCATMDGKEKHILTFFRSVASPVRSESPAVVDDSLQQIDGNAIRRGKNGESEDAEDECEEGWVGHDCRRCAPGYTGDFCTLAVESDSTALDVKNCDAALEPSSVIVRRDESQQSADSGHDAPEELRVFDGFLSTAEVAHLSVLGKQLLQTKHGTVKGYMSRVELSKVAAAKKDAIYQAVEERIANLTGIRPHEDERVYFVAQGSHSKIGLPHHDLNKAPMRVVTVLIFLSDGHPPSGDLQFPCFGGADGRGMDDVCDTLRRGFRAGRRAIDYKGGASKQAWNVTAHTRILDACTRSPSPATRLSPAAGRAVAFRSATQLGTPVDATWHAACPIKTGAPEKLTMQFFKEFPRDSLPAALQDLT